MRLVNVPVRRVTRFKVDLALEGGRRGGESFSGRALNLSVHGLLLESGMALEVVTMLVVPVLYCGIKEFQLKRKEKKIGDIHTRTNTDKLAHSC